METTALYLAIEGAFNYGMLPNEMYSAAAHTLLTAIGLQESDGTHRFQVVQGKPRAKGPARGLWQFEQGGGVKGVLTHPASRYWAFKVCVARAVKPIPSEAWLALERDDVLAAAFARLLLFTDPKPLPSVQDDKACWAYYVRNWRPGKPHPDKWPECMRVARQTLGVA